MLSESLTDAHVQAASRLHSRLKQWAATDGALEQLREKFPGFELEATLLKTVAINQLYGTNVYAAMRVAEHVVAVMKKPPEDAALVEALAEVELADGETKHLRSFASKFCHFFVDRDRYPIFDKYVGLTLKHHLGTKRFPFDAAANPPPYQKVLAALDELRKLGELTCTSRELDRYLWLSGLYREWKRKTDAKINVEVGDMFRGAENDAALKNDLADMSR